MGNSFKNSRNVDQNLRYSLTECVDFKYRQTANSLIRLRGYTCWSRPSLFAYTIRVVLYYIAAYLFYSISKPEQVTLGLQQESQKWSDVVHKYSVKNRGPSPLENKDIIVYVPAIVHRREDLIADTYVEVNNYAVSFSFSLNLNRHSQLQQTSFLNFFFFHRK